MSRRELAEQASCSQPTIFRIEQGDQSPSIKLLRKLLDALDADERTRLALIKPGVR
jgi:transcriptional regulator with XRE-family HTH domain